MTIRPGSIGTPRGSSRVVLTGAAGSQSLQACIVAGWGVNVAPDGYLFVTNPAYASPLTERYASRSRSRPLGAYLLLRSGG